MGLAVEERRITVDQWRADAERDAMTETFACGTAAVVTRSRAASPGGAWTIGDQTAPVSTRLHAALADVQRGRVPDRYGWLNRHAYYRWLTQQSTGDQVQFDTTTVLPFYAWLAASGAFLENHCSGFGTNSTPNHMLIVDGQSPTLRNPLHNTQPVWDLPSLPGHAQDNGLSWKAYTGATGYPIEFYQQLQGSANIAQSAKPSQQFLSDAANGSLPALAMVWHDSPYDEHPTADVSLGQDAVWQAVDAVVQAGKWNETVFLLTWDDWGGFDDHVATPNVEYTPDGVQLAYGPRVPLLMFGGRVRPGIDSRWCSHVSLPKTACQLLGLPRSTCRGSTTTAASRTSSTWPARAPACCGCRLLRPRRSGSSCARVCSHPA
jgi:hypothetical protein